MSNPTVVMNDKMPWRFICALFFGQVANVMVIVVPMMLLLTFKFNALTPDSVKENFGLTAGISTIAVIIFGPLLSSCSDKLTVAFGRRRTTILAGGILGGISLMAISYSTQVWMIILGWCCVQVFYSVVASSIFALVPEQIPESRRGIVSGAMGIFAPASVIIGMMIMMSMTDRSLDLKFATVAGIGIIAALIACMLVKEGPAPQRVKKEKESLLKKALHFYPNPRVYPSFSWGVSTRFFQFLCGATMPFQTIYLMEKFHYTEAQVTTAMGALSIVGPILMAVSSVAGGWLSDKLHKQKVLVIGSALGSAIGILLLVFATSFTGVMISTIVMSLSSGVYLAVDMALLTRILPSKEDFAKDSAIMNIAGQLPNSVTGFIAPPLIAAGGYPVLFGVFAIFGVLSALSVIPIPEMGAKNEKIECTM
ncbi:MAG: major facilitator superfamily 1 [Firmicutes bacterium]|nr:major facilitator superfamily 1 [Bacillota bacterium]